MFEVESHSVEETMALGRQVAQRLQGGEILALTGELGAGKTVFVKGLAEGLGIKDVITSPTFVLVKTYEGRLVLHHIDFYRLETPADLDSIGIDDYVQSGGVLAIEWAEKFQKELPQPYLQISFLFEENDHRLIHIKHPGDPDSEKGLASLFL